MARIPERSTEQALPAAPNQLPSARMTAAPNATDLGYTNQQPNEGARKDLRSALDHFSEANRAIELRADKTNVMTVLAEAQKAAARHQEEIATRKGAFAAGATKDTKAFFEEQHQEFVGRLTNGRQRQAFEDQWRSLQTNAEVASSRHEAREGQAALVDAANGSIAGAIELAAGNPDDKEALGQYRNQVLMGSANVAAYAGHKPGSTGAALEDLKNLSALHETVLRSLVKNDPSAAEAYLKENRGEMNASTRERATKLVETSSRLKLAQQFAGDAKSKGLSEIDAIRAAREKYEGEDEKDIVAEIQLQYNEVNVARERAQKAAADVGWKQALEGGSATRIDPVVRSQMDARDVAAIERYFTQQQESRQRTIEAAANRGYIQEQRAYSKEQRERTLRNQKSSDRYQELRALAVTDPQKFQALGQSGIMRENDVLLPEHVASLVALGQRSPVKDFLTYGQQLSRATANLDKEEKAKFQIAADEAMRRETDAKGKDLTQGERQEIIDRMQLDVVRSRDWWVDKDMKAYQVEPGQRPRVYIPGMEDAPRAAVDAYLQGVPKEALPAILDDAKRRGIDLTPDLIIKQYRHQHKAK